jgi:aspartyl-tRNA(Asn)/glutamyl-tRNA(Gln) amidotransferase subunit C
MQFDEEELLKLAKLCRIECTEEEKKKLAHNLKSVLDYIEQLDEVDTADVEPCYCVLEASNVFREDEVGETLSRELFLANAPSHTGGMIRVPPVMSKK